MLRVFILLAMVLNSYIIKAAVPEVKALPLPKIWEEALLDQSQYYSVIETGGGGDCFSLALLEL